MLCDRCGEKEATVFLTQIVDRQIKRASLCDTCGEPFATAAKNPEEFQAALKRAGFPMPELKDMIKEIAAASGYDEQAYAFVRDGLHRAVATGGAQERRAHVTAAELLDALRSLAVERFGSGARQQLASWGVSRCEDFGRIVFALIDCGIFGKRPEDRPEDFSGGYDFSVAFPSAPA